MSELSFYDEVRRKLVHLSSFWMPVAMILLADRRYFLAAFFLVLAGGSCLVEHAYANGNAAVRRVYDFFFGGMLRKEPVPGAWVVSGGPPVLAASGVALCLFVPAVAAGAMAMMLGGDTAAALVGKRFGRIRFRNGKSLEGVLAFWIAGSAACALFLYWGGVGAGTGLFLACPAAAAGAAAEFFEKEIRMDDNFGIPLCAGIVMTLIPVFFF